MEIKIKHQKEDDRLSRALGIPEERYEILIKDLLDEIETGRKPSEQIKRILEMPGLTGTERAYLTYQAGSMQGYLKAAGDCMDLYNQLHPPKQRSPETSNLGDAIRRKLRLAAEQAEELADD